MNGCQILYSEIFIRGFINSSTSSTSSTSSMILEFIMGKQFAGPCEWITQPINRGFTEVSRGLVGLRG